MKNKIVAALMGVAMFSGCGASVAGATKKQTDAVEAAGSATCDAYVRCNEVGSASDQAFKTRDDCMTDRKAFWNNQWPVGDCDNKINGDKLQFCLDAIKATSCDSFIDALNTVYNKCPKSDVCSG